MSRRTIYVDSPSRDQMISGEAWLVGRFLREILLYIILFIPNLLGLIVSFFSRSSSTSQYINSLFFLPFKLLQEFLEWLFQARYTAILLFILIFAYIGQLTAIPQEFVLTHPDHLFEISKIYTLLTAVFFHGSILHLLFNLLGLLIFGRIVERNFGALTPIIFLAGGFLANLISHLISLFTNDIFFSLGASGAIAAFIILSVLIDPLSFTFIFVIPLPVALVGWIFIGLDIIGISNPSQTNHFAHLGGYLSLLPLLLFLTKGHRNKIYNGIFVNIIAFILVYILLNTLGLF